MKNEYFFIESTTGKKYIRTNQHTCQVILISEYSKPEIKSFDNPYPIWEEVTKASITPNEFKAAVFKHLGKKTACANFETHPL